MLLEKITNVFKSPPVPVLATLRFLSSASRTRPLPSELLKMKDVLGLSAGKSRESPPPGPSRQGSREPQKTWATPHPL